MGETLFRSGELVVRRVGGFSDRVCVVTFDSFSDEPTLDRPGFAEGFLRGRGIDAVHVVSRLNEWFQHPETLDAMAAVRAATAGYGRVLTYGVSMGGYGAIRLAGLAGAQVALAMAPQFSLLPGVVPFEYRWGAQAARQRDVWESTLELPDIDEAYVLFDPLNIDSEHAAGFAGAMRMVPVRLRGAGHQVAGFLQDIGLLQQVVLDACRGRLDVTGLEAEAWGKRRGSAQARLALAGRVRSPGQRIALLRSALVLAPRSAPVLSQLGLALGASGVFAEGLAVHRAALSLEPGQPRLLIEQATTMAAAGEVDAALATVGPVAGSLGAGEFEALCALLASRGGRSRAGRTVPVDPGASPGPNAAPIRAAAGRAGTVLHGPYLELRPGWYEVTFGVRLEAGSPGWAFDLRSAGFVDVAIHGGRTVLARRRLSVAALRRGDGRVSLRFRMPDWTACEFRVRATGVVGLVVGVQREVRRVQGP